MKRNSKPLAVMVVLMVIALIGLGVGYGAWAEQIIFKSEVSTGELDVRLSNASATEIEMYSGGTAATCGVALSSSNTTDSQDDDPDTLTLTIANAYPNYQCTVGFRLSNVGTVPTTINYVSVTGYPEFDITALSCSPTFANGGTLNNGAYIDCSVTVDVKDTVDEVTNYGFDILTLNAVQAAAN